MAKNEMGFLKVIVFPLYEALYDFYKEEGTLRKLRSYAEQNIKEWEKVHLNNVNVGKEEVKNWISLIVLSTFLWFNFWKDKQKRNH